MHNNSLAVFVAFALLFGILALLELGRRIGQRRHKRDTEGARAGIGAIEGAMFGLLGLLIAFTFSGAAVRFDQRRSLIVEEANAVGTAYLRLDLLAPESQPVIRGYFRDYLDSRLKTYALLPDIDAARAELDRSTAIQTTIWSATMEACRTAGPTPAAMLLVPALNQMFDIVTTRTMATQMHPPVVINILLGTLTLMGALLAGFGLAGGKSRPTLHMLAFALIMASTVFVIFDLEHPRVGFLRVDDFDQVLKDLRTTMNP